MTEKVLSYDKSIVPQRYGWDCGPASTEVVLNALGIIATEDQLISEIKTTTNGTNDVSWIETRALDKRVPQANYTTVYLPNDPPSNAQVEILWRNIVASIDAGYGVVMNWVSPPSNPPRAIKGSKSPSGYGSRTIYHYVPCMGYDNNYDGKGGRAVWIADPGFSPFGYWITLAQCATLIPPKGYCYAAVNVDNRAAILARATGLSTERAEEILPAVMDGLTAAQCSNVKRIAMWLAQIGHESDSFNATEEYANGDEATDRWKYKGRTWIQITWSSNYAGFSQWCYGRGLVPTSTYFVDNPKPLADLKWAGLGAAWYWTVARPTINTLSDNGDIVSVTKLINGGTNGLSDRQARYTRALAVGDALLQLLDGDDFLSALTDAEQKELLDLARQVAGIRRPSLSALRHVGEGNVNTCAGFAWAADAAAHILLVERLAVGYKDPDAIALLKEVAGADVKKYPDRTKDAELAAKILAKVDQS